MMWEIWAMLFAGALLVLALVLFKYVYDAVQELKASNQEIKVQIYNSRQPELLKNWGAEFRFAFNAVTAHLKTLEDLAVANKKHLSDLEFYLLKPREINLYTKEPLLIEQVKQPATPRASRAQKKSEIYGDIKFPEFQSKTSLTKEQEAALFAKINSQMNELR